MSAPTAREAERLGAPEEFTLIRDNDRDLRFTGWKLASKGDTRFTDNGDNFTTAVSIYVTVAGRIITQVERFTLGYSTEEGAYLPAESADHLRQLQRDDFRMERTDETCTVAVHSDAASALAWLKEDNRNRLGSFSKAAWVEACEEWPALAGEDVETID